MTSLRDLAPRQPRCSEREEDERDEQDESWNECRSVPLESLSGSGQPVHAARGRKLPNREHGEEWRDEHEVEQDDERDLRRRGLSRGGHGCDHGEVGQRGWQLDGHDACTDEGR